MKRRLRLPAAALAILFAALPAAAQPVRWEVVENGPFAFRFRHDDVRFVNARQGWLVNQSGQIWITVDSGETWEQQADERGLAFRTVAPTSDSVAFVGTILTPGRVLFETRDRGATWTDVSDRITGPDVAALCGLWTVSDSVVVGVGAFYGEPRIVRTDDNGLTWTAVDGRPLIETLVDVHFVDERIGFVTGGSSAVLEGNTVVLRTDDGGLTWTKVFEGERPDGVRGEWGWKISFPSALVGYVSVEYADNDGLRAPAKVLKTVDGGLTWREIYIEGSYSHAGLQSVGFVTERLGWASGRGVSSVTEDGGDSWRQIDHWSSSYPQGELDGSVNRIVAVNDTFAVAVGQRVFRLLGNPVATAAEPADVPPERFTIRASYPNPFTESTRLEFSLDRPAAVRIEPIDMLGRRFGELVSGTLPAGEHAVTWDGRDASGNQLPSGTYLFLIDVGDVREMKQVVRIR